MARKPATEIKVLNPKKVKPEWELVYQGENQKVDRLIEVYKDNPLHARILHRQGHSSEHQKNRVVAYTFENGDINIVHFIQKFGISVTNKMYRTEKNNGAIIYKKETNKWYLKTKSSIRLLTYSGILSFIQQATNFYTTGDNPVMDYIITKLPWVRNLKEDKWDVSHTLNFNAIITHKLFNLKAIYRHMFGIPYPAIEVMMTGLKANQYGINPQSFYKLWKEMKKVLVNVDNLSSELFTNQYFKDTCKMAGSVGQTVNCSWSKARLKAEHDKWSKEISNVLLLNQKNTPLRIYDIYQTFAEYSGYKLLETNYDMIEYGVIMSHCVATYIDRVNSGSCAIYKVDGHTMELRLSNSLNDNYKKGLYWVQIKGFRNADAPNELKTQVQNMLDVFNVDIVPTYNFKPITSYSKSNHLHVFEDLPF